MDGTMTTHTRAPRLSHEHTILSVLVLALAVIAVLAYQTQHAVRSHRAAAEATLRDYAAFASWELGRRLDEAVGARLNAAVAHAQLSADVALLTGVSGSHAENLEAFRRGVLDELKDCACRSALDDFFVLELTDGRLRHFASGRWPELGGWLVGELLREARAVAGAGRPPLPPRVPRVEMRARASADGEPGPAPGPAVTVIRGGDGPAPAPYHVRSLPGDQDARVVHVLLQDWRTGARAVYGFAVSVSAFMAPVAKEVVEGAAVLPPTLTRGRPNEAFLATRVATAGGEELYRAGDAPAPQSAVVDTVATQLAPLITSVAVRPQVAGALLIGGLPRSRLPAMAVLLCIAVVLVITGAVLLRRQQALARLRSEFVAGVSHELRTPLTQISMFAELLAGGRLDATQQRESVRIIQEEAQRLRQLVENVLQFSRPRGRPVMANAPATNIAPVVLDTVAGFAPLAGQRSVQLVTRVEPWLPLLVDPNAIRQIVLNLLDNAVKYGPAGQHVRVAASRTGGRITIAVEDEGPGVPASDRAEVWKPYRRLERDVDARTTGSGIGLAVVDELVRQNGGTTDIDDVPGGGARFVISLPAAPDGPRMESEPALEEPATAGRA
jgi:signal transduction histidine kinase